MSAQGARVIDLMEYRRRRESKLEEAVPVASVQPVIWVQVWMWMPFWPMR